ncbi:DUF4136 domain-containing protein [Aurantiacibacter spongiae]|uniref:DUF4136 domain-containing protein n=1 Tax=Aurantiacibacter spongiae TaxID=2488860 RepID=A0A3N5DAS3_9SPHN|nr:DUF4136 domain-containing protein [Aurantiacibacter spongiae]RPF71808.1 DUF4136 domain-containing protein [Aurantiacibacter spongiae]
MRRSALTALVVPLLAAGCAAPAYVSPVEVTRFVGPSPAYLGQGTIELVAGPGEAADSLEYSVYRDAVRRELEMLGYRVVAQNAQQVASVQFEDYVGDEIRRRGPVNVGVGGSTGSYGSGVGVGVGLDLTPRPAERILREISVAIRPAGGGTNLWEGRASMTATVNSDMADDRAAAARIADALFAGFPGNSGETIEVE